MSEYRVSPTEEERKKEERRKKEKSRFLTVSGLVCRRPLWKVPLCVLVVFHTQVTIMTVRRLDFIHRLCYFRFCNVLHIWTIRAIPTYRVYRLYDNIQYKTLQLHSIRQKNGDIFVSSDQPHFRFLLSHILNYCGCVLLTRQTLTACSFAARAKSMLPLGYLHHNCTRFLYYCCFSIC